MWWGTGFWMIVPAIGMAICVVLMVGSRGNQYNMGDAMPVFEVVEQPAGDSGRNF